MLLNLGFDNLALKSWFFDNLALLILNQAKDTASIIRTSGLRLLQLINDILDAAKMKQCQGGIVIKQGKVWSLWIPFKIMSTSSSHNPFKPLHTPPSGQHPAHHDGRPRDHVLAGVKEGPADQ